MDFKNVRLIATDMDGTLLNSRHELHPDFFIIFQQLRQHGILFSAASGRQFYNLYNRFEPIKNEVIFIAENGSYVFYNGEELLVQDMPYDVAMQQLKIAKGIPGAMPVLCGKKQAYIDNTDEAFVKNVEMYYDRYKVVDNVLNVTDDQFLKIAICDLKGAEVNSYPHFKNEQGALQVKVSGQVWLDISHKFANKGRALKMIQQRSGITKEQTMVFGDYYNDLEMLGEAAFSYAMKDAPEAIKKAASYEAESNNDNGVLKILQQVVNSL